MVYLSDDQRNLIMGLIHQGVAWGVLIGISCTLLVDSIIKCVAAYRLEKVSKTVDADITLGA